MIHWPHFQDINGYWFIFIITVAIIIWLIIEAIRHEYYYKKIPYRIHVNGTRGKSSVCRLIAAGLRAGGLCTCAKTTGTLAEFIYPDGHEEPIFRVGHTNIIEQLKVIRKSAKLKADALVIECMAVQPLLQSICELKVVKSTHGVLTNARPDHLDVMGPTEEDVAYALAGTIPVKGIYFTTEQKHLPILRMASRDRQSRIVEVDQTAINAVSDEEIQKFVYEEHKENVALALAVCSSLGIAKETALQGMWSATPDPGALSIFSVQYKDHTITFANGFAANDPVSTRDLWHRVSARHKDLDEKIIIFNCRIDRKQRSVQLAESLKDWEQPDKCLVIGTGTKVFTQTFAKKQKKHLEIVNGEGWSVTEILDSLISTPNKKTHLVVGVGNIAGIGFELLEYFIKYPAACRGTKAMGDT